MSGLLLLWLSALATAQNEPVPQDYPIDVERFRPIIDPYGYALTESSTTLRNLQVGVGVWGNYSENSLVLKYQGLRVLGPAPNQPDALLDDRPLFWRIDRPDRNQRAVRLGRYKYLQILAPTRRPGGEEYLFDVVTDPSERRDLADQEPAKLAELKAALANWEAEMATESPRFVVK